MKYLKVYITITLLFVMLKAHSQSLERPFRNVSYNLNELVINDSVFLNDLYSFVFEKECPEIENRVYQYFIMNIEKEDSCTYKIDMECAKKPYARNSMGYFVLNDYYFFVFGCNPNNTFQITKKTKRFEYMDGGLIFTEEFPRWFFVYRSEKLHLLEYDCW